MRTLSRLVAIGTLLLLKGMPEPLKYKGREVLPPMAARITAVAQSRFAANESDSNLTSRRISLVTREALLLVRGSI